MQGPEDAVDGDGEDYYQSQLFPEEPDPEPAPRTGGYFDGHDASEIDNESLRNWGIRGDGTLYRHSYLYQVDFPISDESEAGLIELRGRTWSYDAKLPAPLADAIEASAKKAATLFNSTRQTADYAGYLDGFLDEGDYSSQPGDRWEREEVGATETETTPAPGQVDWNVEIYIDGNKMSGVAEGLSYPWTAETFRIEGEEATHATPHEWKITYPESRGEYQLSPPGRVAARERYKPGGAGHDKVVHVNGRPVGRLDEEGRTWLKPEYARGDGHTTSGSFGTYWSREGLVAETAATYQALRKGGKLYLTGETENAIHLRTARAKPEGWRPADPEDVSPTLEVRPGREPTTSRTIRPRSPDDAYTIECDRDERLIKHLGKSLPTYRHAMVRMWEAP